MASNKNQHFVPKCYLRPFTEDCAGAAISLFNIDRSKCITNAPAKNQCSGSYFYGQDPDLEAAIQFMEGTYASTLRRVIEAGYCLNDEDRDFLKLFWLLQHMRTEAASKRAIEMMHTAQEGTGAIDDFRMQIRDAVQMAMYMFTDTIGVIDDLKVCLIRNRSNRPFVTSDDPAILSNRWHLESKKARGKSFGLNSAGALFSRRRRISFARYTTATCTAFRTTTAGAMYGTKSTSKHSTNISF